MRRITHVPAYLIVILMCFHLSAKQRSAESASMINVTYPSSSTVWELSKAYPIYWNSDYLHYRDSVYQRLRIDLELDGQFINIARDIEDIGSHFWTVPDSLKYSSTYNIIVSFDDLEPPMFGTGSGVSADFTINGRPDIKITAPRQGTTEVRWALHHIDSLNETIYLYWKVMGALPASYDLFYRSSNMKSWEQIAQNHQEQSYRWPIPYVNAAESYTFKVVSHNRPEVGDSTIDAITITPVPQRVEFPVEIYDSRPRFRWHPVGGVDTFFIEATNYDLQSIFSAIVTDTFYVPQSNLPEGKIYWRVWPGSSAPELSKLKTYGHFFCNPIEPRLIKLSENPTRNTKPSFSWHSMMKLSDFIVYISTSEDITKETLVLMDTTSDTTYQPDIELPYGEMYWSVKSLFFDSYSETGKVIIVPDTLPFLKPFKEDTIKTVTPVFEWEPIEKARSYKIEIFSDNPNALGKRRAANQTELFLVHSEIVNEPHYVPSIDLPVGKLFWHVSSDINFEEFSPMDEIVVSAAITQAKNSLSTPSKNININHTANGSIHIRVNDPEHKSARVRIYSIQGKCIYSQSFSTNSCEIDPKSFMYGSGVYILKASTQNNSAISKIRLH